MTQNQINFAKLQEDRRHNLATEGYTGIELAEAKRHNQSSEGINWYSATESARHNQAQEGLNWYSATEAARHNQSQEGINWFTAQNLADLQYYQGQQAQSQAYLNDVRGIVEDANYALDKWYKEQQIAISATDAATRERAQRAAEKEIGAQIENLMRRLVMDEGKYELVKAQIMSEIVRNYLAGGKSVGETAESVVALLK